VTAEKGAAASVMPVTGNVWIKEGATFWGEGPRKWLKFSGAAHTFCRDDNPRSSGRRGFTSLSQWVAVEKQRGASVEFLGNLGATDELKCNEGVCIVGPDSRLQVGAMSIQVVGPDAVLELQSGAAFHKAVNYMNNSPDILVYGRVQAGSPERPITRDATLGVSYKWVSKDVPYNTGSIKRQDAAYRVGGTPVGLAVDRGAQVRVYSADPRRARLHIGWHGIQGKAGEPQSINMALYGDVQLDGVLFDHIKVGGIVLPDLSLRSRWKNVYFGPHNEGPPKSLFAAAPASQVRRGPGIDTN
jgi:hypothetical protein